MISRDSLKTLPGVKVQDGQNHPFFPVKCFRYIPIRYQSCPATVSKYKNAPMVRVLHKKIALHHASNGIVSPLKAIGFQVPLKDHPHTKEHTQKGWEISRAILQSSFKERAHEGVSGPLLQASFVYVFFRVFCELLRLRSLKNPRTLGNQFLKMCP